MWILYARPPDYPHSWVARRWAIYEIPQPTPDILVSPSLEVLEDILRDHGFAKLERMPNDAPEILSTWI